MLVTAFSEELAQKAFRKARSLRFWKIFLRLLFVILKTKGYSNTAIADILLVSRKTIVVWQGTLQDGGLEALSTLHYKGQPSKLNTYSEQLALDLDEAPVATLKEAQHRIEKITNLHRSLTQIRAFLQRLKIKRRKVGQIPSKANVQAQERFKVEKLEPLIKQAQVGLLRLFFVDASHFVHRPFLGYLYGLRRKFIRAAAGRRRFNVLGALDAVTHELITFCNDTYITATTVCYLLELLARQYANETIYVILDNARYQRCALVQATAVALGIQLVFLEPYSPQLNLIERLWRFVKKEVLYDRYYSNFEAFKTAITTCLQNIDQGVYQAELRSLLTLRFQSFQTLQTYP